MTRQRHTRTQIATKLGKADEMTAQGELQGDIAKSLGVSVMTYYRWRKAREASGHFAPRPTDHDVRMDVPSEREQRSQIGELQLENARLRRLVTDLLLEKVRLEEDLSGGASGRRAGGRN